MRPQQHVTPDQRAEYEALAKWFCPEKAVRNQCLTDLGLLAIALLVVILITLGVI